MSSNKPGEQSTGGTATNTNYSTSEKGKWYRWRTSSSGSATAATLPPALNIPPPIGPPSSSANPHKRIAVHCTRTGIVLRPLQLPSSNTSLSQQPPTTAYHGSAVRIHWGKEGQVDQLEQWSESDRNEEATKPLAVEGVAGLLRGFHLSYLLLVTSSSQVASLARDSDPLSPSPTSRTINSVDQLLSVPLELEAAKSSLDKAVAKQTATIVAAKSKAKADSSIRTSWGRPVVETNPTSGEDSSDGDSQTSDDDTDSDSTHGGGKQYDSEAAPDADEGPIVLPKPKDRTSIIRLSSLRRPFWKKRPTSPSTAATKVGATDGETKLSGKETIEDKQVVDAVAKEVSQEAMELPKVAAAATGTTGAAGDDDSVQSQQELDGKIVKECLRELKGMYFSTSFDITHSLQHKYEIATSNNSPNPKGTAPPVQPAFVEPSAHLPLWRRADRRFWWNAHLASPFVQAGLHSYILVLQQGFVQQTTLELPIQSYSTLQGVPSTPGGTVTLSLVLISRRSVERPGLRYQRRGTNVHGQVANFVESEFIISCNRDGKQHVASFVQTRGSIPVFWSQQPWALKPPPVLERTKEESQKALAKHFEKQVATYGRQVCVNLAEHMGKEGAVVGAYREGVEALGEDKGVKYVEWDFHHECRGMKYENIAKLTTLLQEDLESINCFWSAEDQVFSTQTGVCRTNCIDCLDRTNVVQSAISRWVLNRHLVHLGLSSQEEVGMHDELDQKFNGIWADNGDAISREYAGTSALKGDFTRTGKRNIRGALNDASNSVARLLQSTVSDFFHQGMIDFVTGNNLNVFAEFQERMATSDPGEILRLAEIRLEAIETSAKSVLVDDEDEERLAAWTLLGPAEQDTVRSAKYEEKVLLLSSKAVYVISYEYTLQKVMSFTRIPTGDIVGLQKGVYILSALDAAGRDQKENYGFIIKYHARAATERVRSYSMRIKPPSSPRSPSKSKSIPPSPSIPVSIASSKGEDTEGEEGACPAPSTDVDAEADADDGMGDTHFFAFKALRKDMVRVGPDGQSRIIERGVDDGKGKKAKDTVDDIVIRLRDECARLGAVDEADLTWVVEKDIIGLKEAQAQTSIIDTAIHGLKALIWL
ncbi:hypothetical protein T439DRAFT_322671 [Meredithblackwellia eburnea MCA 4105]